MSTGRLASAAIKEAVKIPSVATSIYLGNKMLDMDRERQKKNERSQNPSEPNSKQENSAQGSSKKLSDSSSSKKSDLSKSKKN